MAKPILCFLNGRGISLTALIANFTNQARCECKVIFEIHVIALVFICCGWSVNWVKLFLTQPGHRFILVFCGIPSKGLLPYLRPNHLSGNMGQEAESGKVYNLGEPPVFCGNTNQNHFCHLEGPTSLQSSPKINSFLSKQCRKKE